MADLQDDAGRQEFKVARPPVFLNVDGSLKLSEPQSDKSREDWALLDSALLNLNIAQQYIDESRHLVEHRLICFHYAVALLARYRGASNRSMLALARQYFVDSANWRFLPGPDADRLDDAHARVVCEAHYNLGVIDELSGDFESAEEYYGRAARTGQRRGPDYAGVEILAKFGVISAGIKSLKREVVSTIADGPIRRQTLLTQIAQLKDRIASEAASEAGKAPAAPAFTAGAPPEAGSSEIPWWQKVTSAFRSQREVGRVPAEPPRGNPFLRRNTTLTQILKKLTTFETDLGAGGATLSGLTEADDDFSPTLS